MKKHVKDVSYTTLNQFVTLGILFLITVVIARLYGVSELGVYASWSALGQMVSGLFMFGFDASILRQISFLSGKKDRDSIQKLASSAVFFFLGFGLLIFWFLIPLSWLPVDIPANLALLLCLFAYFRVLNAIPSSILIGLERFKEQALLNISSQVIIFSSLFFVSSFEQFFYFLAFTPLFLFVVRIILIREYLRLHFDLKKVISLFSFAKYIGLTSLFKLFYAKVDILLVTLFLGTATTGLYSAGISIANLLTLVPVAVGTVMTPLLSRYAGESNMKKTKGVLLVTTRYLAVSSFLSALGLLLLARPLISLLYGEAFIVVETFLPLLIIAAMLTVFTTVAKPLFWAYNKPHISMWAWLMCTICILPLDLVFIPLLGVYGASIVRVLFMTLMFFVMGYNIYKLIGREYVETVLKILVVMIPVVTLSFFGVLFLFIGAIIFLILMIVLNVVHLSELRMIFGGK